MQPVRAINRPTAQQIVPLLDHGIHPASREEIPTNRSTIPMSI
jgi:hypothetical protein